MLVENTACQSWRVFWDTVKFAINQLSCCTVSAFRPERRLSINLSLSRQHPSHGAASPVSSEMSRNPLHCWQRSPCLRLIRSAPVRMLPPRQTRDWHHAATASWTTSAVYLKKGIHTACHSARNTRLDTVPGPTHGHRQLERHILREHHTAFWKCWHYGYAVCLISQVTKLDHPVNQFTKLRTNHWYLRLSIQTNKHKQADKRRSYCKQPYCLFCVYT